MSAMTAKTDLAFDRVGDRIGENLTPTYGAARGGAGLAGMLGAALRWVAEQPRRRAVINELAMLSDHELADIGLARGELHRVFDRDFGGGRGHI